jgi:two-component system, NarL family, sensor kinase
MKILFLQFLLFCSVFSFSQSIKNDLEKLEKKLAQLKAKPASFANDTLIVNYLIAKSLMEGNLTTVNNSIATVNQAIKLAESINWNKGIMIALSRKSEALQLKSQYFSAIQEGLKLLKIINKKEFPVVYYETVRTLGSCYMWMEKPVMSKKYYDELIETIKPTSVSKYFYYDLNTEYGALLSKYLNQPEKSFPFLAKAKLGYESLKDTIGLAYVNSYLGIAYNKTQQNTKAEIAFETAINYYRIAKVNYLLPDALNYAAEYYNKTGNFDKAIILADEALQVSSKLGILFSKRDSNRNLYQAYHSKKNFEKAFLHYKNFADSRDSMNEANIDDRLKVVRYDYDTQIQKAKITQIEKEKLEQQLKIRNQNTWLYVLIASLLGLSLLAFFYYSNSQKQKKIVKQRNELQSQKIKELEQEKQLTAVSSIMQGQEVERSRMAKDLHDGLGGMLSGIKLNLSAMRGNQVLQETDANIFTRSIDQLDRAISEMRRVAHNMMPEALLKFGLNEALQDFCDGINESNTVRMKYTHLGSEIPNDQSLQVIIYRIIQELSNNAIKYANASTIFIQLNKHLQGISLTVEDDGKGFDTNNLEKVKGAGLQNVISRVNYLKGEFAIESNIGKGTTCTVEIPNQ